MNIRRSGSVAGSLAIVALAAAGLYAQANAASHTGTVEHIKVHGKALEGNLEGDSPDRDVTVYLPPSYATERTRRYPVVYLLHGYGGTDANWTGRQLNLPEIADTPFAARSVREMIVVDGDQTLTRQAIFIRGLRGVRGFERLRPAPAAKRPV